MYRYLQQILSGGVTEETATEAGSDEEVDEDKNEKATDDLNSDSKVSSETDQSDSQREETSSSGDSIAIESSEENENSDDSYKRDYAGNNPYPTQQNVDGDAYYEVPCTWFAWQQVYNNEGIALPAWGNAGTWLNSARNAGYATGNTPQVGAVAVWTGGYGHVAYVSSVQSSTTFTVNEGGRTDLDHTSSHGIAYGYRLTNSVGQLRPYDSHLTLAGFIYPKGSAHTHSYTARSEVIKQPTCIAAGTRRSYCSCGQYQDSTISALGHNYTTQVTAPTLTEKGYTLHTCTRCGNTYKDNYVDPPTKNNDGWYYGREVPSGISSGDYDIQYQNHYVRQQESSPGSGWTQGTQNISYENVGSQYEEYTTVNTSDEKVLVRYYYFHFCSGSMGNRVNYAFTNTYNHWDSISNPGSVSIQGQGHDDDSVNIPYYILNKYCQSGDTCDGKYGSHGHRSNIWYRMNVYQNRRRVVTYQYTKDSDWTSQRDGSASSVTVRFKEKKKVIPVSGVKLNYSSLILNKGEKTTLSAKITPDNATNKSVSWKSDRSDVAAVSSDGKVTAFSEGTAKITATAKDGSGVSGSCTITVKSSRKLFSDMTDTTHPYYNAIYWASGKGITTGFSDGTFKPYDNCTRGQVVTFLWRLAGKPEPTSSAKAKFSDMVASSHPYYKAILWAVEKGITTGFNDGTFKPFDNCSRGQIVTFIYRYAGQPSISGKSANFKDMVSSGHPFYNPIVWASTNGITTGFSDNTFGPAQKCTRGQVVTFLYRYSK